MSIFTSKSKKTSQKKNKAVIHRINAKRERNFVLAFALPALIMFFIFRFLPSILGLAISLFRWKGVSLNMTFVGLENYVKLFQDQYFYNALKNFMIMYAVSTIIIFGLALAVAVLLTGNRLREKNMYRVLLYFPTVIPAVIINIVWMGMFNPNIGVLNDILGWFNIAPVNWLGDQSMALGAVAFVMVWKALGFYMVLFMAAIENIPKHIFEAANIDGCKTIRQTFKITIPLIWEQIRTSLIFFIVTTVGVGFNVVFMMTKGGPMRATEILPTYMYKLSFGGDGRFGYASAVAVMILIITSIIALIIMRVTKREVYEL
jgi:N-acetylglucosamine transport system permease protein